MEQHWNGNDEVAIFNPFRHESFELQVERFLDIYDQGYVYNDDHEKVEFETIGLKLQFAGTQVSIAEKAYVAYPSHENEVALNVAKEVYSQLAE